MFFEPHLAVPGCIIPSSIYRHFKGGYYVVHAVARREEDETEVVVYQSLQTGQLFTRPLVSFTEKVPEDKDNPTGQLFRFERVVDFNNQLSLVSTENLVKELESRADNPFSEVEPVVNNPRIWKQDYIVGEFTEKFNEEFVDGDIFDVNFTVWSEYNSIEEARSFVSNKPLGRCLSILKRVFLKVDS